MAKRKPRTLDCDPFPQLSWGTYYWECADALPGLAGFLSCGGDYGSADDKELGSGSIALTIATSEKTRAAPTTSQIEAYKHLRRNAKKISVAILKRVFSDYAELRSRYGDFVEPHEMPEIDVANDLKRFIGFSSVHLHRAAKDGVSYAGIQLGCTWDDEHGLGVMMHKNRVVEFGGADAAILEWIADADAKR